MKNRETYQNICSNVGKARNALALTLKDKHSTNIYDSYAADEIEVNRRSELKFVMKLKSHMIKNDLKEISRIEFMEFRDDYNFENRTNHWLNVKLGY